MTTEYLQAGKEGVATAKKFLVPDYHCKYFRSEVVDRNRLNLLLF